MGTTTKQVRALHSLRPATVLLVGKTLKNAGEVIKISELKRRLPKNIMHSTLLEILDHLQKSGKILIGTKGVLWVFTPSKKLEKAEREGLQM